MRNSGPNVLRLAAAAAVVWAIGVVASAQDPATNYVSVYGGRLVERIVGRPPLEYPQSSLAAGREGVVVAQVRVSPAGQMDHVDILQAPDEQIAASARNGLMKWTFRPMQAPGGTPAFVRSKLILYFMIRDGAGTVRTAYEMRTPPTARELAGTGWSAAPYPVIDDAAWQALAKSRNPPQLLDIRKRDAFSRSHLPGAINIPEDELTPRSLNELSMSRPIVVDCPAETKDLCSYVEDILQRGGFKNVSLLKRK